jgi:predicted  nucleic acid-binding Zn-ribbon protein
MSRPKNIYRLQSIDSQLDQARGRLKEIEKILSENANLRKANALAKKAEKNLETALKEQRQAEGKVQEQRIKIEQAEATLYSGSVKNPKELQDIQNEVEALKRFLDVLEERQLVAMLASDEAADKNREAQKILAKYQQEANGLETELALETAQIEKDIAQLSETYVTAENAISSEDLDLYRRLRKQRGGIAATRVKDQACGACGSTLTASLHQAARSPSQLTLCTSCGRILYAT